MGPFRQKLEILADARKYERVLLEQSDRSRRRGRVRKIGGPPTGTGDCQSYTSRLEVYLAAESFADELRLYYCQLLRQPYFQRHAPCPLHRIEEVVNLTMDFYRRNLHRGLFVSSGIHPKNSDIHDGAINERGQNARTEHSYGGFTSILKTIPNASQGLIDG